MPQFDKDSRNRICRVPQRGSYDQHTIYRIIDEALICHVGFVQDGQPFVIPTIHARLDDELLLHGARASRLLKQVQSGSEVCVAITLLDGLVLARSIFNHSMNYRSVVLFGKGRLVDEEEEKLHGLRVLSEHVMPGRWADARPPTPAELDATTLVAIAIESATAKIRTGPPLDDEQDYALPVWAGVLPIQQQIGDPVADPRLGDDIPVPEYIVNYHRTVL